MAAADPTIPTAHRRLVWTLILTALVGNVVTLFVPFIVIDEALQSPREYSLVTSVRMMWESGLYILALVIVLFSVLFPFAKIGVIATTLLRGPGAVEGRLLHLVERLGKWSMIDVFIVCFILALTNDQLFIGTEPRIGIYTFLGAIILSLAGGSLLRDLLSRSQSGEDGRAVVRPDAWTAVILAIGSASFVAVLVVPFIAIDDWLLDDRDLSLALFLWALLQQGAPVVAVVLGLGLVAVPAWDLGWRWWLWIRGRRLGETQRSRTLDQLRNWGLMDVFLVSLLVFLVEGKGLMSLEGDDGLLFIALLCTCYLARGVVVRQQVD